MPRVENEPRINAPNTHGFEFVATPSNDAALLPTLREIDTVEMLSDGGHGFADALLVNGRQIDGSVIRRPGRAEPVDPEPPKRLGYEMPGDIQTLAEIQLWDATETTLGTLTVGDDFARSVRETVSDPVAEQSFTRGRAGILPNLRRNRERW